jgi:hypothetical protein
MTFVNKIYNKTQTGQLLLVSLEELTWELGIANPLHMNLVLLTHGFGFCGNL